MLKIYNSLSREKEVFQPIQPNHVSMYVCGMTVYDYCHVGHARVMVVFDMVQRWLKAAGYTVNYVRNVTDIDDKIIQRAAQNKEPIDALTGRFIAAMHEDADALLVERPTHEPRATQFVPQMVAMIQILVDKGLAYQGSNGDVFYAVQQFPEYGKLSGKSLDDLRAGERVDVEAAKHYPLDFVLWKSAKPGEPAWDSPWGAGRPGWHIECSVMSACELGDYFDLHGGGQDLQFPHHENEIAQSEGAHGHKYVNYWMHNGFIRVNQEKMAKSLGNFFTIRDVLKLYDPEVLRYFILAAHYRSPLDYSDQELNSARQALTRLYTALKGASAPATIDWASPYAQRFKEAMDDDFNTPIALSVLFDLAHEANRQQSPELASQLKALAGTLGLLQRDAQAFLQAGVTDEGLSAEAIEHLIEARRLARQQKDFARADAIRQQLQEASILLEDSPSGTTWRRQ